MWVRLSEKFSEVKPKKGEPHGIQWGKLRGPNSSAQTSHREPGSRVSMVAYKEGKRNLGEHKEEEGKKSEGVGGWVSTNKYRAFDSLHPIRRSSGVLCISHPPPHIPFPLPPSFTGVPGSDHRAYCAPYLLRDPYCVDVSRMRTG